MSSAGGSRLRQRLDSIAAALECPLDYPRSKLGETGTYQSAILLHKDRSDGLVALKIIFHSASSMNGLAEARQHGPYKSLIA